MAAPAGRPPELAEIFRAHAAPLEQVGPERRRVVRDIVSCRTPLLGGHLQVCNHCGHEAPLYNSCRNRHCPKCQNLEQTRWVEAQARGLLPVEYFHLVFTVPKALHPFFLMDRRGSYALLFEAALEALHDVCRRRLGALPGTTAILHTWTQTLVFHPHLHCIVTGGGLAASGDRWIASRPGFLVPVRVLSKVRHSTSPPAGLALPLEPGCYARRRADNGWSTARRPWPAPRRCSAISAATPIASPSATSGWWPSETIG